MVELHAAIRCRCKGEIYDTTVGRVLVSDVVPREEFPSVNKVLDKKALGELIDECYRASRNKTTVLLADRFGPWASRCDPRGHLDLHRRHEHPDRRRTSSEQRRKTSRRSSSSTRKV